MKVIAAHWESPFKTARSAIIAGCIIVLFMFVGFGGWAATVYIASAAIGQGTIGVSLRRQTIQHQEGGIIAELRVQEGSYVKAGDLLIRLDETKLRAAYDLYRNQYLISLGEKARLEAQRDDLAEITFPKELLAEGDKDKDPVVRSQTNIFTQLKEYMRGQELIKREQESQLLSEIDALQAQKTAEVQKLALVKEELTAVEDLYSKGLEKKPRLLALQRSSAEIEGNIGQYAEERWSAKSLGFFSSPLLYRSSTAVSSSLTSASFCCSAVFCACRASISDKSCDSCSRLISSCPRMYSLSCVKMLVCERTTGSLSLSPSASNSLGNVISARSSRCASRRAFSPSAFRYWFR